MRFFLGIIGVMLSFLLIKYRERMGDAVGDPEWASKVGGIYNVLVFCGAIGFFWSIAYMTNTLDVFFGPILSFIPGAGRSSGGTGVPLGDF